MTLVSLTIIMVVECQYQQYCLQACIRNVDGDIRADRDTIVKYTRVY